MKEICVLGLGYIGLPTASLLATKGYKVCGVDVNIDIVESLKKGISRIYEPDLDVLIRAAVQSGNLLPMTNPQKADIFIIAVPTPFKDNHEPDLSYIQSAVETIAPIIEEGNIIILESTSPVGTTEKVAKWLAEIRQDLKIPTWNRVNFDDSSDNQVYIVHCPERVLPGQIIKELVDNDRIIGGINRLSAEKAKCFYKNFVKGEILLTDSRTAEFSKLVENAFRDVNIAFANELSILCDTLEIDVWKLIELSNRHPRVNILKPGPGVGGHCIAVDPWFIVSSNTEQSKLIHTARQINDYKANYVVERIIRKADRFKEPIIACLGLSYKADIDDLRESPALEIVCNLAESNVGKIYVVEPHINTIPTVFNNFENIKLTNLNIALKYADIVVLLVDHRQFLNIKVDTLKEKTVIDTRGIWR